MNEKIFDDGSLEIIVKSGRYYLRYDAGAHQVAIREDEISKAEAEQVMSSEDEATKVLFSLQRRLEEAGVKPYESNVINV